MRAKLNNPTFVSRHSNLLAIVAAFVSLAVGMLPANSAAQSKQSPLEALRAAEAGLTDLIARVEPAIVAVSQLPTNGTTRTNNPRLGVADPFGNLRGLTNNEPPTVSGAGIVIDANGLVLTQYLAIDLDNKHRITTGSGKTYDAKIKAADPRSGLAVLEIKAADLPALPIGKAEKLRKGSFVLAVGNPYTIVADGQPTASVGAVTNLGQRIGDDVNLNNTFTKNVYNQSTFKTTLHHFGTLIQTDARLGWNAAGGALINLQGELVGVTTTASTTAGHEQPAGYAIPLNKTFRRVVDTLRKGEEVEYGMLGIRFDRVGVASVPTGVQVSSSLPGWPAAKAGLRSGDIIIEIDGQPIRNGEDLQLAVGSLPPQSPTPVKFLRSGETDKTEVALAKQYVPGKKIVTNRGPAWRGVRVDHSTAVPPQQLLDIAGNLQSVPPDCVVVSEVDPRSVSWKQGVRPGMFISHVGETRVTNPQAFYRAVGQSDNSIKLRFIGGNKPAADQAAREVPNRRPKPRAPQQLQLPLRLQPIPLENP